MTAELPVLIVGAGPTGLVMAAVLQRYGVAFRIIDKKAEPTHTSNALAIHAATLRLLDGLGLADVFLKRGYPLTRGRIHTERGLFAEIDLSTIESRYAFVLSLAQSETEAILTDHLAQQGVTVERGMALTKLENLQDITQVTLTQDHHTETFAVRYIVAADGSHSTVRHLANLPFTGEDLPTQFILADAHLLTPLPKHMVNAFYTKQGILAAFPFNEHDIRLIADVPAGEKIPNEPAAITAAIEQTLAARTQQQLRVDQYRWVSTFWIHNRCLPHLRHDNLFFCGDAAHLHSPVGGQGMNAGMQDAYNLGWKLALVIQGQAQPGLLRSYEQERLPVAQRIVQETLRMTQILLARNWLTRVVRHSLRYLLKSQRVQRAVARHLSMLDTRYLRSAAICSTSCISNRSPQPGSLAPELPLDGNRFWLLIFTGYHLTLDDLAAIKNLLIEINHRYAKCITPCVITPTPLEIAATQLQDANLQLHRRFNLRHPGLCLIRPDNVVALCSADLNVLHLKKWLQTVLTGAG